MGFIFDNPKANEKAARKNLARRRGTKKKRKAKKYMKQALSFSNAADLQRQGGTKQRTGWFF